MLVLIVSSSLDDSSRSERLAHLFEDALAAEGSETEFVSLRDKVLPRFDNSEELEKHPAYQDLHGLVSGAEGLVLAGPVYNWGCSAELKRFYEFVVHPSVAGHGPTLLTGLSKRIDLKLASRLEFGSGVVAMRYLPRG